MQYNGTDIHKKLKKNESLGEGVLRNTETIQYTK